MRFQKLLVPCACLIALNSTVLGQQHHQPVTHSGRISDHHPVTNVTSGGNAMHNPNTNRPSSSGMMRNSNSGTMSGASNTAATTNTVGAGPHRDYTPPGVPHHQRPGESGVAWPGANLPKTNQLGHTGNSQPNGNSNSAVVHNPGLNQGLNPNAASSNSVSTTNTAVAHPNHHRVLGEAPIHQRPGDSGVAWPGANLPKTNHLNHTGNSQTTGNSNSAVVHDPGLNQGQNPNAAGSDAGHLALERAKAARDKANLGKSTVAGGSSTVTQETRHPDLASIHQPNSGASDARNSALERAKAAHAARTGDPQHVPDSLKNAGGLSKAANGHIQHPEFPQNQHSGSSANEVRNLALERAKAARDKNLASTHNGNTSSTATHPGGNSTQGLSAFERAKAARDHAKNGYNPRIHVPKTGPNTTVQQKVQTALPLLSCGTIKMPSKVSFQTAQQKVVSKLPAEKQQLVNDRINKNAQAAANSARRVDLVNRPGRIDLFNRHSKPGPNVHNPNSTNAGGNSLANDGKPEKHYPGWRPDWLPQKDKQNPFATLLAANSGSKSGLNAGILGAFATGLVLGTIGDAILMGPGILNGGGIAPNGGGFIPGGGFVEGGDPSDPSQAFNNGCVFVPNESSGDFNPGADGSGVMFSICSNSSAGNVDNVSEVPPVEGTEFVPNGSRLAEPIGGQSISLASTISAGDVVEGRSGTSETVYDDPNVELDAVPQTGRFLNVANLSSTKVIFHVQYHALDQAGNWNWFPANPENSDDALVFEVEPGRTVEFWDQDWQVSADRVRIWANSANDQHVWNRYKGSDLLLVPERDESGQPTYLSPEAQTLNFAVK